MKDTTATQLARMELTLEQVRKDVEEIKTETRQNYALKSDLEYLKDRVTKIESNLNKVVMAIILGVLAGLLSLILK